MLERVMEAFKDVAIERELGSGTYGTVFAGTYNGMRVALKVLNLDILTEYAQKKEKNDSAEAIRKREERITKFILEFGYLARVNSPHIVSVYDAGIKEGMYYLVMEDGGIPLSKLVRPLSINELTNVYYQAIQGLDALHESGLAHRDIKPDNILIDQEGCVRLTDLGFVNLIEEKNIQKFFVGNLLYAAPEQLKRKDYDKSAADIYSLGLVTYELAAGRLPYGDIADWLKFFDEKQKNHPKISRIRTDMNPELAYLIQRSLLQDSELRPTTKMLRYDLYAIKENQPLSETTMLNDDVMGEDLPFSEEKLRKWKELDVIIPTEAGTEEDHIFINPQNGRKDYRLDIPNKGTKKRFTGRIAFPDKNRPGYLAFTIASEDYAHDKRDRRFGDIFIIKKYNGFYNLEYRKYGERKKQEEFRYPENKSLEFVIERFSNSIMFGCYDHILTQCDTYTPAMAQQEIWVSATTPVLIDGLKAFYEVPGKVQDPLYHIERSFAEGKFEIAEYLATNLLADLSLRDPLVHKIQLYIAKSLARKLHSKENVGELESALMVLETLRRDLKKLKEEAPTEIAEDAEHEFLNVLFFTKKDYWEAYAGLMDIYRHKLRTGKDTSGIIAQGMMFAHQAPDAYRPFFESLRRNPREWGNAPAEI